MNHRKSAAVTAAASKASWDTVKASRHHHDDDKNVTSVQNASSPTAGLFKQRKAIGRHSELRTSSSRIKRSDADSEEKSTVSKKNGKGPPSLLERPRSSTGFEDYFDELDASAKLRSLKAKPSLQELKRLTLWERDKKDLPNSPRERRCVSSLEKKELESNYDNTNFQSKNGRRSTMKSHRVRHGHDNHKDKEDEYDEKGDKDLDLTDKIKAFRELVSPDGARPRSRRDGQSQRDISNEQLKRARSYSSVVEEVGGYVKFSSQSSEVAGMRSSTPLNVEDGSEGDVTVDVNRNLEDLTLKPYLRSKSFVDLSSLRGKGIEQFQVDQRNDLPSSFKAAITRQFGIGRSEVGYASNRLFGDKYNESEKGLSENTVLRSSRENAVYSVNQNNNYFTRKDKTNDKSEESGRTSNKRRIDPKKIIRRSPNSERARQGTDIKTPSQVSDGYKPSSYSDLDMIDKEVLQHMIQAKERRRRRDQVTDLVQKRAQSSVSGGEDDKEYGVHETRSTSSLDFISRSRGGNSLQPEITARPVSALETSDRAYQGRESRLGKISESNVLDRYSGRAKTNVGSITQGDEISSHHRGYRKTPGNEVSLRTHLNTLGASLSSLSSRLTSSSESDLRSYKDQGHSYDAGDTVAPETHKVKDTGTSAGTGEAADVLSRDISTSTPRRQSGGGRVPSPFDVAHVRISIREGGLDLQTWASASSLVSGHNGESPRLDTQGQRRTGHSGLTAVRADHSILSDTSSTEIGSPYGGRQTNVKVVLQEGSLTPRTESSCASSPRQISENDSSRRTEQSRNMETVFSTLRDEKMGRWSTRNHTTRQHEEMEDYNSLCSKTSESFQSQNHTLTCSEDSDLSMEDTLISDGATHSQLNQKLEEKDSVEQGDSKTNGNKPKRPKVISRKTPLKAVHPLPIDQTTERNSGLENAKHNRKHQTSPDNKEKVILVKRPTDNRTDNGGPRKSSPEGSDAITRSSVEMLKATVQSLASSRSKSSLGLLSNTSSRSSILESPLPSKASMKQIADKIRPKTSLAIPITAAHPNKKSQKTSNRKTAESEADNSNPTKGALLKQKVQRLHEDITRRLHSKANSSYSINSNYDYGEENETETTHQKHRKGDDIDNDSDTSDSCLSDASTIQRVYSPDGATLTHSPRSPRPLARRRSPGMHSDISSPLSSPKPGFITSTPVKSAGSLEMLKESNEPDTETRRSLLRRVARELSKGESEKETDTAQSHRYGRFTPDAVGGIDSRYKSTKRSRLLKARSREEGSISDDDDDDEVVRQGSRDERYDHGMRRSESVGSMVRTKANSKNNFMGRILDKMAGLPGDQRKNGVPNGDRLIAFSTASRSAFTDLNSRVSGRQSPADMLLDHLDNPQMVKLLQRLYKADPDTRRVLMVKFQYFKAWVCYAQEVKEKRIRKEALAAKSESHLRSRLLCLHFVTWWQRATHCAHVRRADALLRRHTLAKGLKALSWSLSQSRHTAARIQTNVRTAVVKRAFDKWKTGAVTHRLQRKQAAFARWSQFVTETKKVRHMQQLMDFNLQQEVIRCWHKRYRKRIKLNMAFHFFRQSLCQKALCQWKLYVAQCKLAQEKLTSAVAKHQKTLLNNAFYCMLVSYKKVKRAKTHFRAYKLSETLWAWREAAQVCQTERLRDMAASTEHWRSSRLRQGFSQWREALQVRRLQRFSQAHLYRSAFTLWYVAWQRNIERREAFEVTMTQNKLRGALLTWRQNVVRLRMRHKKAVVILEHCHMKQTFKCWRLYTAWKGVLKKKVLIHSIEKSKSLLLSTFAVWKEEFCHRREQERQKQLWSTDCARKYAVYWKLICHKRKLRRLHQDVLRPVRENRTLRAMFSYWITSLGRRHLESEKADEMRDRLQKSRLHACFFLWQRETNKALLVKPLQQRREQRKLSESLSAWRSYVVKKSQSRSNFELFKRKVMKSTFESWRRQYQASQISKQVASRASQGLLLCFLEAWRFLIERKRKSREFRKCKLTRLMFLSWRGRASFEMDRRARLEAEEASNQRLKEHCFYMWRENSRIHVEAKARTVEMFLQRRCETRLCTAFLDWRRHMHSTLISRAYHKSLGDRLVATLFCEWREVTSSITHDAVRAFSERIGLQNHVVEIDGAEPGIGVAEGSEQDLEDVMNRSVGSFTSSMSPGSSVRRLYGDTASSFDTDTDRMVLLSGGLQASVNDHQVKCQRLKEMATLAIIRLKNWPVCLAFEQWREFAGKERQLKKSMADLRARLATLDQTFVFRIWRENYRGASLARKHRTHHLTQASFEALRVYKNHRKYVKTLNSLAQSHCMLVAGRKYFYPWLTKTQDQRKQKQILHLWSSRTEEEMQLLPLETQLTNQITRSSLTVCFSVWLVRYRAVTSIRAVVRRSVLSWVFTAWRNWAELKHDLASKSKTFRDRRVTKLVFARWCNRLLQAREVERRHQVAWESYLLLILQQWRRWAAASKQLALIKQEVSARVCRRHLGASFSRWRSMAVKVKSAQSSLSQRITYSVFAAWRQETIRRREEKALVLQCQVRSYTLLVERLFRQWSSALLTRQQERQERQLQAEDLARTWARHWRRRAQTSRGQWFKQQLDRRRMVAAITIWNSRMDKVHGLYSLLETLQRRRETELMSRSLQTWRLQLSSARAVRLREGRLLFTLLAEWRVFTKESKDRRIRGMALKKALQERSLHVYFRYWITVTRTSQSIQQSVEKRILFRILRSWRDQSRNQKHLRNLYSHFRHRMETRILQNAFQTLRWRADYCAGLQETMLEVIKDKERATLKAVVTVWRDRLDNILADRFYIHLLMVRTARQWHRFVHRTKLRRQTDAQNLAMAVRHHGLTLCRKILKALKTEVSVSTLAQKHRVRLCFKYARIWKTKVDYVVTARAVERESAVKKAWTYWRILYSKRCAAHKIVVEERKYLVNLIFTEWRKAYCTSFMFSASMTSASSSSGGAYLKPVTYLPPLQLSSAPSSSTSSSVPSLQPVSTATSHKRLSLSSPSPPPMSAAGTSFGFRGGGGGGGGGGRRKQN